MSRPAKATVDYFGHKCKHGRVIFVLESLWGNDGYALFYKIYELLGDSEGHVYDLNKVGNLEFLLTYIRVNEETADIMLTKLADLGIIDGELLKNGIIWSQCFVDDLVDVYSRRKVTLPTKPCQPDSCIQKPQPTGSPAQDSDTNPQSILNHSKSNNKTIEPAAETSAPGEDETVITPTLAEAIPIAQLMYERILTIDPKFKASETKLSGWARDIEKLIRIDCRSPDEIKAVVEWVYQDSFWKGNILSGGKLREKFTQLLAASQRPGKNTGKFDPENFARRYEAGEI